MAKLCCDKMWALNQHVLWSWIHLVECIIGTHVCTRKDREAVTIWNCSNIIQCSLFLVHKYQYTSLQFILGLGHGYHHHMFYLVDINYLYFFVYNIMQTLPTTMHYAFTIQISSAPLFVQCTCNTKSVSWKGIWKACVIL